MPEYAISIRPVPAPDPILPLVAESVTLAPSPVTIIFAVVVVKLLPELSVMDPAVAVILTAEVDVFPVVTPVAGKETLRPPVMLIVPKLELMGAADAMVTSLVAPVAVMVMEPLS